MPHWRRRIRVRSGRLSPEIPSGKIYGETAREDGAAGFAALRDSRLELPGHPGGDWIGAEVSPFGGALGITYPAADAATLITAAQAAAPALAEAAPETRVGACLEALARLNRDSFLMGNAVMHTTGQPFAMAFQAGGPHAQDRGLEAVAMAWDEMTRFAPAARWDKPQGKAAPIVLEKHWTLVPAGIALAIGCNTFPTWNSYSGIFASLATGNPVIVKPHPAAVLRPSAPCAKCWQRPGCPPMRCCWPWTARGPRSRRRWRPIRRCG